MPRNYVGLEEKLSRMVSIPTVAGGPYEIARYRQTLRELFPHLFRQAEEIPVGEALLLKLEGAQAEEKPVLFSGHMDVVAAPPEGWEHPPFSGEIVNGEVWGRGSLDMKGAQCALLAALDALLEESWRPQRTVYLYLSCDEEIGGPTTARAAAWLEAHGVRLEAVFDEGGTVGENFWGKIPGRAVLVAVAEKGSLEYRFTARADGGHAANPPKHSAIVQLSRLTADLEDHSDSLFRRGLAPQAEQMLREMARWFPQEDRDRLLEALDHPENDYEALQRVLPEQAPFLLGATIAFTMVQGGTAFNVMPKEAVLTANVRPSTVQGECEITELLCRKAAEYGVTCELVGGSDASPFSSPDSKAYRAIADTAREIFGEETPVIPFVLVGGTDSKHFLPIAGQAIRFSPIFIGEKQGGVHGVNEYITVDSLRTAAQFYEVLFEKRI